MTYQYTQVEYEQHQRRRREQGNVSNRGHDTVRPYTFESVTHSISIRNDSLTHTHTLNVFDAIEDG